MVIPVFRLPDHKTQQIVNKFQSYYYAYCELVGFASRALEGLALATFLTSLRLSLRARECFDGTFDRAKHSCRSTYDGKERDKSSSIIIANARAFECLFSPIKHRSRDTMRRKRVEDKDEQYLIQFLVMRNKRRCLCKSIQAESFELWIYHNEPGPVVTLGRTSKYFYSPPYVHLLLGNSSRCLLLFNILLVAENNRWSTFKASTRL